MYYLYYAGMAADRSTEQIGMAVSDDGLHFTRIGKDGLLIPRDPDSDWKDARVCNPTVVRFRGEWLMFYHGAHVHGRRTVHAIGIARSADGLTWVAEPCPILSIKDMIGRDPGLEQAGGIGGVIEPAVVVDGNCLRMWFLCYAGSYRLGTRLYTAESVDGTRWIIDTDWLLSSRVFGRCSVHYPQVVSSATESMLWFTVQDWRSNAFAICRMKITPASRGSTRVDDLEQVLPQSNGGLNVGVMSYFGLSLNGRPLRGIGRLNRFVSRMRSSGRNYFGYAHSHILEPEAGRMYYHAYHDAPGTGHHWMDIGSCELFSGLVAGKHTVALTRSRDRSAWDAFFVADPFVVRV